MVRAFQNDDGGICSVLRKKRSARRAWPKRDRGESASDRGAPVVGAGGAGNLVGPDDLAVGEVHVFQMSEMGHVRVLAVGHARLHVDEIGSASGRERVCQSV